MENVTAYPLQWPQNKPRRLPDLVRSALFKNKSRRNRNNNQSLTVWDALDRLDYELEFICAEHPVISTNLVTRLDGLPRSGQPEPDDVGIALYFHIAGKPHCMPCDTYDRVADNIAAIAAHIEATRKIERHGVASVAEMFTGFIALPSNKERHWTHVLGVAHADNLETIKKKYQQLARERHPDNGGSDASMAELNRAYAEAKIEAV